ncbi:MAG: TonB family protein [Thermoanaerobaculia bacterium]|nr:TonB family protein [Thermoanaerobaculia bacterium]
MSWIVVLESEGRPSDALRETLAEDGWLVDACATYERAAAAIAERAPLLLIANAEVGGAERLLAEHGRSRDGLGTLALVAAGSPRASVAETADAQLRRPFSDQDLRLTVRGLSTAGRAPKAPPPAADGERLTSQDLFGDLLAEVEADAPRAAAPPAAPAAAPPVAAGVFDRQLGDMLKPAAPRAAAPASKRDTAAVDDLLSKTLSGLEMGDRAKRPAAAAKAPAKPAPRPAPPSAPPAVKPPAAKSAAAKPQPVDRLLELTPSTPTAAPRRPAKELDLSSLDALARPAGLGDKTPSRAEPFATQKIAVPSAARAGAGPVEFGQYTLLERIALGGMAEVWKARMKGVEGFQKTVAIKKILPHLTDSSDFVTMFVDEAKLAAQLNHTNIIHIYDLGKIADDYYIAMEYVDGKDLRSILNAARDRDVPLPLGLSLLVASRLAAALDHAHRQKDFEGRALGLVHRDVSPQNVLISFDGDIKLCDFGIVKAVSKASKTQMGALKGKLQYMSPEQAWGRPVDARSDIFSLGTLLFEMLTGRRLFAGESEMSVLDAVREGRIQAPRDLDPRVPLEVNATVLKSLAREPKDRFQSAGDLQREIDGILASLKPTPSQRDLAHYVQRLFDVGARPSPAETAATAAPAAMAPPAAAPARGVSPAAAPLAESFAPSAGATDAALETAPAGKGPWLWVGLAAAVVLGIVGVTMFRGGGDAAPPATAPAATTEAAATESAAAPPAAAAAVTEATPSRVETDAPAAPATPDDRPPAASAATSAPAVTTPAPQPEPAKAEPAKPPAATPAATASTSPAAAATTTTAPPVAAPVAAPPPAVATRPAPESQEPAPTPSAAPTPQVVPPAAAPRAAATPPAAPTPRVREGDLVPIGPGVEPPVLVSVNKPEYPPVARRMRVEGTVVLSVLVDETGRVLDIRLESGVSQKVGINEAAIEAARSAKFRPATLEGVRVKTWHRLTIPFKL